MLVTSLPIAQFQARRNSEIPGFTIDSEGCNEGHYYLVNNATGDMTLVINPESNLMTMDELHQKRLQVAQASNNASLLQAVATMKAPSSGGINAHPLTLVGVASYGTDGLHAQFSLNMFQVYLQDKYLNSDGTYSHANFNCFIPKQTKNALGQTVINTSYEVISEWHQAAQNDDAVRKNGDVIVAVESDGKWVSTGHSNQVVILDETSLIAFSLLQKEDGSYATETVEIDGRSSKSYKVRSAKVIGDFAIQGVVGSRRLVSSNFTTEEESFLSIFTSVSVAAPVASTSPIPAAPGVTALNGNAAAILSGVIKKRP